jgi:hypothetical protein
MKNITLVSLTALIFYLVLSFVAVVSAAGLVLQIKASKANYVIAEPVVLYVSLQNTSNDIRELPFFLNPDFGLVYYYVKRLGTMENLDESKPFFPWAIIDHLRPTKDFAPGEIVREEVKLFFNLVGWTFKEPGTYEVTARLGRGRQGTPSNTLTITVHAPTDEQTAQAAELFLGSTEVGYFLLFEGGDHLKEGIQRLQQVVTQYPNTPHATYANQALGRGLVESFFNRHEDPASAIQFLEKAKQNPVSFYDVLHTHLALYDAYTKLNKTAQAKSVVKDLVQLTATQFEGFLPFLDYYRDKGSPLPEITQTSCLLYAVHDKGKKENQFFSVNLAEEDFEAKPLGLVHHKHDFSLAAADFDGDGEDEIALAAKQGAHTVTLYELDGTKIRSFPVLASGISLAAGDMNGNSTPEIIVASKASNSNSVFVYAAEGTAVNSIAMFDKNTRMSPTVGDIDGDKRTDIIAGRLLKEDQVAVYNSANQERRHFSVFQSISPPRKKPDNSAKAKGITYGVRVAADDFDGDGKSEIVAAMASRGSQVEVYSSDGTLLKAFTAFDSQDGVVVTVGNVVNDGQPEIIVGEAKGTRIRGFNLSGEQVFEFQAVAQGTVSSLATFRCEEK